VGLFLSLHKTGKAGREYGSMARKPNYNFEKRRKELAKKAKKEEKLKRRQQQKEAGEEETAPHTSETAD